MCRSLCQGCVQKSVLLQARQGGESSPCLPTGRLQARPVLPLLLSFVPDLVEGNAF